MRVISGNAKGKKLSTLRGSLIRPTSDRTREAIFNILSGFKGAIPGSFPFNYVLDIFAGTGALGVEALSRGASKGFFIESNIEVLKILENNLKICKLFDKAEIIPVETSKAISLLKGKKVRFNLVFVDPPYDRSLVTDTLKSLLDNRILAHNGIVVVEHSVRELPFDSLGGLTLEDRRKYGRTMVSFYNLKFSFT